MTDTLSTNTPETVRSRPDGMMDEQWRPIAEGLACGLGSTGRLLAERCLDQFNTMVTAAEQRQVMTQNLNATINKQARWLEIIADDLLEEARRREWCSEYDDFAEGVNSRCGQAVLKPCRMNYNVTFTVSVIVNARDENSAEELAGSIVDRALGNSDVIEHNISVEGVSESDD